MGAAHKSEYLPERVRYEHFGYESATVESRGRYGIGFVWEKASVIFKVAGVLFLSGRVIAGSLHETMYRGGFEMDGDKLTKELCIGLLRAKADELRTGGEERFPKRADFSEREVVAIKAFFGPWPRALEAAGLKEPRGDEKRRKTVEKRIRAKRRRTEAMKQKKSLRKEVMDQ